LIDQTKKNRELPRIECSKCGKPFSTQWARSEEDRALARGPVVSERFEQARNFCNKLWNASRLALLNLEGYSPAAVSEEEITVEDRWILSRLSTVTKQVTDALEGYHYATASRALYDFVWDEFCSFYLEMIKGRLQSESTAPVAQRVLAHTLDVVLRLLHPMIPFITEEVWQLLNGVAPQRGIVKVAPTSESIMVAPWPEPNFDRQDAEIEKQFALFQTVLGALREIRSRQQITREQIEFAVCCNESERTSLQPMEPYFQQLANATAVGWGTDVQPPEINATVNANGMEVYVDLKNFIDVAAEIERNEKQEEKLVGLIAGKKKKLSNKSFVDRAPVDVVEKERQSLSEFESQLETVRSSLENLRSMRQGRAT
jgi:valyl-tRNA synthetase